MSMFLPEGATASTQPPSGVADITPADPQSTSADIALMQRVLSAASRNPNLIPADFMSYVLDWIQTQRLTIPIGQVFGFSQFKVQSDYVAATETTTSTTYTDLATIGPTLNGLSDGKYLVLWGCAAATSSTGTSAVMSVFGNGSGTVNNILAYTQLGSFSSVAAFDTVTLANGGSNIIQAKYTVGAAGVTGTFAYRNLLALKYANL